MAQTNAERQCLWRERYRGESQGNKAMMEQLVALQGRVAQLEVDAHRSNPGRRQDGCGRRFWRCGGNATN